MLLNTTMAIYRMYRWKCMVSETWSSLASWQPVAGDHTADPGSADRCPEGHPCPTNKTHRIHQNWLKDYMNTCPYNGKIGPQQPPSITTDSCVQLLYNRSSLLHWEASLAHKGDIGDIKPSVPIVPIDPSIPRPFGQATH